MPLLARLVVRLIDGAPVRAAEVVTHEPSAQVRRHLLRRLVAVRLGRGLLGQPIHPLCQAVGPARVRLGQPVLDAQRRAHRVERVERPDLAAIAVLEAVQRELAPIVRQDLADSPRV